MEGFSACGGARGRSSSANTIFRGLLWSSPGAGWHCACRAQDTGLRDTSVRGSWPAGRGCGRSGTGMREAASLGRPPATGDEMQAVLGPERLDRSLRAARGPGGPRLGAGPVGICIRERGPLVAQPRLRALGRAPRKGALKRRPGVTPPPSACRHAVGWPRSADPPPILKPEGRDPTAAPTAAAHDHVPAESPASARPPVIRVVLLRVTCPTAADPRLALLPRTHLCRNCLPTRYPVRPAAGAGLSAEGGACEMLTPGFESAF